MPYPRRAAKSQVTEKTQPLGPNSQIRPPSDVHREHPAVRDAAAGKRTGSMSGHDKSRKRMRNAPHAGTGAGVASTLQDGVQSSQEGLPPSNQPSNPPVRGVGVTSNSLRGGLIPNHSPPSSTASTNASLPSSSQSSELGSVASFTGRPGTRSALHSGSLELASVLEAAKRLLERYCYRVSPFIVPGDEMLDVSVE
jgi:hypothetical protein